jgi:hypothetical protein
VNVAVNGSHAYVAHSYLGVQVVDIATPQVPVNVGGVVLAMEYMSGAYTVAVEAGKLYAADRFSGLRTVPLQCSGPGAVGDDDAVLAPGISTVSPNPFNSHTSIRFELAGRARTSLRVYDLAGSLVRTLIAGEDLGPGPHERAWTGRDDAGRSVASGIYLYRLEAGGYTETKRITLVK